jgi:hypothetical protein
MPSVLLSWEWVKRAADGQHAQADRMVKRSRLEHVPGKPGDNITIPKCKCFKKTATAGATPVLHVPTRTEL